MKRSYCKQKIKTSIAQLARAERGRFRNNILNGSEILCQFVATLVVKPEDGTCELLGEVSGVVLKNLRLMKSLIRTIYTVLAMTKLCKIYVLTLMPPEGETHRNNGRKVTQHDIRIGQKLLENFHLCRLLQLPVRQLFLSRGI